MNYIEITSIAGNAASRSLRFALPAIVALLGLVVLGTSAASGSISIPAPGGVTATRVTEIGPRFGSIKVEWNGINKATGYDIRVSDDGEQTWSQAATNVQGTLVSSNNNVRRFSFTLGDDHGVSSWLPYHVSMRAAPNGTWSGSISSMPYCPVGYACANEVLPTPIESDSSPSTSTSANVPSNTTGSGSVIHSATTPATPVGSIESSRTASVYLPPLAAPETVYLTQRSQGQLTVRWRPVAGATSYNILYSDDGRRTWKRGKLNLSAGGSLPSYTIGGLDDGGSYVARVQAVRNGVAGPWKDSNPYSPAFILGIRQLILSQVSEGLTFNLRRGMRPV